MTERRISLLFRVLLFIVRGGLRSQFPGTARERDDLERELEKELDNIQLRSKQ